MSDRTIISSRVRLARNFVDMRFPSRISEREVAEAERIARAAAKTCFEGSFYHIKDLDDSEIRYLIERRLISPGLADAPFGSVLISADKQLSVMIMEEDHVRAQSFRTGSSLAECFETVKEYDLALRGKGRLAFDKKLGYLTACPTNVGTGMRASVMLFLPGITLLNRLASLEEELKNAQLTIRGSFGEGSKGDGFCYQISNAVSIGVSEETILNRVTSAAERIAVIEKDMLSTYYRTNKLQTQDAVFRAEAILRSAKLLSQSEAEELLVKRKIGCALGIIEGKGVNEDELMLMCKPISLLRLTKCADTSLDRDAARAKLIQTIITDKEE